MELTEITGNLLDQQYQHSLFSDCAIQLHEEYYLGTCPFHQETGHNTLHVSKKDPQWYCTACGAGGTWYQYLERREGLSSEEILMRLIDAAGLSGERLSLRSLRHQIQIANLCGTAHLFYQSALQNYGGKSSMDFLQRAGYSQAEIKQIEVGHYPDRDGIISHMLKQGFSREMVNESGLTQQNEERPFRLTIPARDPAGNLIGFICRRTGGEKPIYRFSHPVVRDQVFNLHNARGAERVILVEEYLDALLGSLRGIPNLLATGGLPLNESQLDHLENAGMSEIVLALDSDTAGIESINNIISLTLPRENIRCRVSPMDPEYRMSNGLLSVRGYRRLGRIHQMNYSGSEWQAEQIINSIGLESELGVKTAKEQVLKYASTLTDPEERERILILLHERFGSPESRLRKKLEILQKEERVTSYIISELRNDLQMPHEVVS